MTRIEDTIYCDGCGTEITVNPVASANQIFCCEDCRDGLECHCGDRMDPDEYEMTAASGGAELPSYVYY